jgi:hypothetical protein
LLLILSNSKTISLNDMVNWVDLALCDNSRKETMNFTGKKRMKV